MPNNNVNFEQGVMNLLKQILERTDINVNWQHHGENDPFHIYTVTLNDKEIFHLKYAIGKSAKDKHELTIDKKTQTLSADLIETLYRNCDAAYWAQEHRKNEKAQQAENYKQQQDQARVLSFLDGFTRK